MGQDLGTNRWQRKKEKKQKKLPPPLPFWTRPFGRNTDFSRKKKKEGEKLEWGKRRDKWVSTEKKDWISLKVINVESKEGKGGANGGSQEGKQREAEEEEEGDEAGGSCPSLEAEIVKVLLHSCDHRRHTLAWQHSHATAVCDSILTL